MTTTEVIALISATFALLGYLTTTAYYISVLKANRKQLEANYKLSLRNKSLSYSIYASPSVTTARLEIDRLFSEHLSKKEGIPLSKIEDYKKSNPTLHQSIMTLLAHWENLALAIHSDVADNEVARDMVAGTLTSHVKVFREFINSRIQINRRAYENLLHISDEWDAWLNMRSKPTQFEPVVGKKALRRHD